MFRAATLRSIAVRRAPLLAAVAGAAVAALSIASAPRAAHADALAGPAGLLASTCFGSIGMTDSVAPRAMESWEVCLEPGRLARLSVVGDGSTKLDCDLVGPDERVKTYTSGTRCDFRWRVKQRGNHRLEVRNRGEATNVYTLEMH